MCWPTIGAGPLLACPGVSLNVIRLPNWRTRPRSGCSYSVTRPSRTKFVVEEDGLAVPRVDRDLSRHSGGLEEPGASWWPDLP